MDAKSSNEIDTRGCGVEVTVQCTTPTKARQLARAFAFAPQWAQCYSVMSRYSRSGRLRVQFHGEADMLKTFPLCISMLLFAASVPTPLAAQRPLSAAGRSVVYAPHGIVATSQPLASSAGLAVLQSGGNAIDAAVTAAAVLSVTEPMMPGMGGDMFATVWVAKEHRLVAITA